MNLVLSLSLVLVMVPASATGAVAGGAVSEEVAPVERVERVDLEVDHSALLEHQVADAAEDSAYFVLEDATKALTERHGVQVVDDAEAPRIVVRLGWKDYENSVYWIVIATQRPGREPEIVESFEAKCIDSTALSEAVVGRLRGVLERLGEEEPVPDAVVTEPGGEADPTDTVVARPTEEADSSQRRPLGLLGRAGVGTMAGGGAVLVGGGVMFLLGQRFEAPTGRAADREGHDLQPPGIAVMVAGGAALVAGVALLAVDRVRARRASVSFLLPSPRGVVIVGRF